MENSSNANVNWTSANTALEAIIRDARWMATLAHELREPLSFIILSLDELESVCAGDPATKATQQAVKESGVYMGAVIQDILDLYRANSGALPACADSPLTERSELSQIVMAAVRHSHLQMVKRRHHLSVSAPVHLGLIARFPSRLLQILTNLLVNAAKYTEPGGNVALDIQHSANMLVISVRDNGIGMTPQFAAQVFADQRPRTNRPSAYRHGFGIGLALVKSLVELECGTVVLESEGLGKGSEVTVRLPNCIAPETTSESAIIPLPGVDEIFSLHESL